MREPLILKNAGLCHLTRDVKKHTLCSVLFNCRRVQRISKATPANTSDLQCVAYRQRNSECLGLIFGDDIEEIPMHCRYWPCLVPRFDSLAHSFALPRRCKSIFRARTRARHIRRNMGITAISRCPEEFPAGTQATSMRIVCICALSLVM